MGEEPTWLLEGASWSQILTGLAGLGTLIVMAWSVYVTSRWRAAAVTKEWRENSEARMVTIEKELGVIKNDTHRAGARLNDHDKLHEEIADLKDRMGKIEGKIDLLIVYTKQNGGH